ncbi:MAG: hypothetical protein HY515_00695 [Candidatus Aenigmarchaeota archaeon]|nr:hypothetical protein [Candidatus Aenigmarchaeota archaeon]
MSYIGRVAGVGATQDGNPVLLYGLSGRSPSSRSRIAVIHGNRVSIEPYGEMTPEQKAEASRLIYDAIMTRANNKIGVVSNGNQTSSVLRAYLRRHDANKTAINAMSGALRYWGHEGRVGDRYNTPRIAGMVVVTGNDATLGIVTAENETSPSLATGFYITRGTAGYLSTYTGDGEEPQAPKFNYILDAVREFKIEGKTAQELAEEMYDFMDPEFVVSTAAALWVPSQGRWKLAVKNKLENFIRVN